MNYTRAHGSGQKEHVTREKKQDMNLEGPNSITIVLVIAFLILS